MSEFSPDWLALRAPADAAARSTKVRHAAAQAFADMTTAPIKICDLGSGTGASVTAFAELFPFPQHWTLVDADAENLERAQEKFNGPGAVDRITIETITCDLSHTPAPWSAKTDLVTATALFDLVSPDWLKTFANRLAIDALPLFATLTYDGCLAMAPGHPLDDAMIHAFNRHQQSDKGFGAAAGPLASTILINALEALGYDILSDESPWRLDGDSDNEMIRQILTGWASAVTELNLFPKTVVENWREARLKNTTSLTVGHKDFFATPPVTPKAAT
jgi:hypothetical protein